MQSQRIAIALKLYLLVALVAASLLGMRVPGTATADAPIIIDFETAPGPDGQLGTPDDLPLTEGTFISNQFASLGVEFFLVGRPESPYIATAGGEAVGFFGFGIDADQPTASGVNTLTDFFSFGSGIPSGASPVDAEYGAQFSTPVSMVRLSLIDFGDCPSVFPKGTLRTASLEAFDAANNLVDSDSFTIAWINPFDPEDGNIAQLEVAAPGIVKVQTAGTVPDCGTAIDDFTFKPSAPPVGGIAELPDVAGLPLKAEGSSGPSAGVVAGVVAAVAAGALALGGAAWYARRRS